MAKQNVDDTKQKIKKIKVGDIDVEKNTQYATGREI